MGDTESMGMLQKHKNSRDQIARAISGVSQLHIFFHIHASLSSSFIVSEDSLIDQALARVHRVPFLIDNLSRSTHNHVERPFKLYIYIY